MWDFGGNEKSFCNFAILQFGHMHYPMCLHQPIKYSWQNNNLTSPTKYASNESRSLVGGKWRFTRIKVRLYPEETSRAPQGPKKDSSTAAQGAGK